jgi:GT2 family glycosyltransferase
VTGPAGRAVERCAITVVIATRNRARELDRTLRCLFALPERPHVIVVDNASSDGTSESVRREHPDAEVIALGRNMGATARNVGVACATSRYVAFSDDDSWWEPGSLRRAAAVLETHPGLGIVAARVLVGADGRPDPVNALMAASPLAAGGLPGPRVLGFLGCAAVVRRTAFLSVGGFSDLLFFGAEEQLLALDLASAGWSLAYLEGVTARHWPSDLRDVAGRRSLDQRNRVLIAWMRRPVRVALQDTAALARRMGHDPQARTAFAALALGLPRALRQRRPVPPDVEAQARLLECPPREAR